MQNAYKLSVCIPNYNRLDRLEKLIKVTANLIVKNKFENSIEICISDDCSVDDPWTVVACIKEEFPSVEIVYSRNEQNMGMDYNFLNCVLMAHGEYAWIVGNDDIPTDNAFEDFMNIVNSVKYQNLDFIVTPFDSFDYEDNLRQTTYPFGDEIDEKLYFDTSEREQLHNLVMKVQRNGALFDFLSNVIFKRARWIEHGDMFADKIGTIFIQIYMNIQSLSEGAKYLYIPRKIIKNYLDDETNETYDRMFRIVIGLYDVFTYFFEDQMLQHMIKVVVDRFVSGTLFEMSDEDDRKEIICSCKSEKVDVLKRYYVAKAERAKYFDNKSVVIYGAGNFGIKALTDLKKYEVNIIGFCDADRKKQGSCMNGYKIFDLKTLLDYYNENMVIVVANYHAVAEIIYMLERERINNIAVIT